MWTEDVIVVVDTGCVGSLREAANAFVYNCACADADHTQASNPIKQFIQGACNGHYKCRRHCDFIRWIDVWMHPRNKTKRNEKETNGIHMNLKNSHSFELHFLTFLSVPKMSIFFHTLHYTII